MHCSNTMDLNCQNRKNSCDHLERSEIKITPPRNSWELGIAPRWKISKRCISGKGVRTNGDCETCHGHPVASTVWCFRWRSRTRKRLVAWAACIAIHALRRKQELYVLVDIPSSQFQSVQMIGNNKCCSGLELEFEHTCACFDFVRREISPSIELMHCLKRSTRNSSMKSKKRTLNRMQIHYAIYTDTVSFSC